MGRVFFGGGKVGMEAPSAGILASDIAVGSTVKLMENGSAVDFIVVHQRIPSTTAYHTSCNGTWIMRKDLYTTLKWGDSYSEVNYPQSNIPAYLDGTYYNLFDANAKAAILPITLCYDYDGYGSSGNDLAAKVFIPSANELGVYQGNVTNGVGSAGEIFDYFKPAVQYLDVAISKAVAKLNGTATVWFTRTLADSYRCVVGTDGKVSAIATWATTHGIRPTMILSSNAIFDEETMILKGVA